MRRAAYNVPLVGQRSVKTSAVQDHFFGISSG
jgi:hypothetical protein